MPITRQDVNNDITAKITGKTTAKSINPTEDGANRVLMMDYVDQKIPYKVYSAFLQFLDGSITPTVLANTIGNGSGDGVNDIAWSYNTSTEPKAVMTNAPFIAGKCVYIPTMYFQSNTAFSLKGTRITDSEFRLSSAVITTGNSALAFVSGVYVEIRIYN